MPISNPNPASCVIHYTGTATRQFKFALDALMDRQYRQSGVEYGLLHALSLRMARKGTLRNNFRPYIHDHLTNA